MRSKQVKTSTPSGFIVLWLLVGATADSRHNGSSSILVYYNDVMCFKSNHINKFGHPLWTYI